MFQLSTGKLLTKSLVDRVGLEFVKHTDSLGTAVNYTEIIDDFANMRITTNGTSTPLWIEKGIPEKSGWIHDNYYIRPNDTLTRSQQLSKLGFLNPSNINDLQALENELKPIIRNALKNNSVNKVFDGATFSLQMPVTNNGITIKLYFGENGYFKTLY